MVPHVLARCVDQRLMVPRCEGALPQGPGERDQLGEVADPAPSHIDRPHLDGRVEVAEVGMGPRLRQNTPVMISWKFREFTPALPAGSISAPSKINGG